MFNPKEYISAYKNGNMGLHDPIPGGPIMEAN